MPRKPGMTRDDLFNINADIAKGVVEACAKFCPEAVRGPRGYVGKFFGGIRGLKWRLNQGKSLPNGGLIKGTSICDMKSRQEEVSLMKVGWLGFPKWRATPAEWFSFKGI